MGRKGPVGGLHYFRAGDRGSVGACWSRRVDGSRAPSAACMSRCNIKGWWTLTEGHRFRFWLNLFKCEPLVVLIGNTVPLMHTIAAKKVQQLPLSARLC